MRRTDELLHYGIKGMKWKNKKSPAQILADAKKRAAQLAKIRGRQTKSSGGGNSGSSRKRQPGMSDLRRAEAKNDRNPITKFRRSMQRVKPRTNRKRQRQPGMSDLRRAEAKNDRNPITRLRRAVKKYAPMAKKAVSKLANRLKTENPIAKRQAAKKFGKEMNDLNRKRSQVRKVTRGGKTHPSVHRGRKPAESSQERAERETNERRAKDWQSAERSLNMQAEKRVGRSSGLNRVSQKSGNHGRKPAMSQQEKDARRSTSRLNNQERQLSGRDRYSRPSNPRMDQRREVEYTRERNRTSSSTRAAKNAARTANDAYKYLNRNSGRKPKTNPGPGFPNANVRKSLNRGSSTARSAANKAKKFFSYKQRVGGGRGHQK